MHAGTRTSTRLIVVSILAGALGIALLASGLGADRAGAGAADAAAVRGYIVPTANNPDVDAATTCAGVFADNDQSDSQPQSPAGTANNAVTLAGCSYNATPFGGPSTEDRPVAFAVTSGPGGLLCGQGTQQSQVCALGGINFQPGAEYRVRANNEAGEDATGTTRIEFCADDPPAEGRCGAEDEQGTTYTIAWGPADGAPPPDGGPGPLTLDLKAKKQKLKKKLKFSATATVASTLVATGKAIKETTKQLAANQQTTVKAKLKRKQRKKLAKKLDKKGKAKVKVQGTATTQSGAEAADTVKVKLKD
jgi:hypothetical protein